MTKIFLHFLFVTIGSILILIAQTPFEVTGLCIKAPEKASIDRFVTFMDKKLAPMGINTLVLRIDYNYAYTSRPELRDENPLTESDVEKLVATAKKKSDTTDTAGQPLGAAELTFQSI